MTDIYSQQKRNRRITYSLMLGFFIFVLALGLSVDVYTYGDLSAIGAGNTFRLPVATIAAFAFASINGFTSYFYGSSIVIRSLGAQELKFDDQSHKRFRNTVTEMALASRFFRSLDLVPEDDISGTFRTHHGDLSRRPCKHKVSPQMAGIHGNITSAVSLTYNDCNLWHCCFAVSIKYFCTMPDDSCMFLIKARQTAMTG